MLITISLWLVGSFLLSALLGWRRICIQTLSRGYSEANYSACSDTTTKPRAWRLAPTAKLVGDDRARRRLAALARLVKRG